MVRMVLSRLLQAVPSLLGVTLIEYRSQDLTPPPLLFARVPTALWPRCPAQEWAFLKHQRELTTLPVLRYSSGHREVV